MTDQDKTEQQLRQELAALRQQLADLQAGYLAIQRDYQRVGVEFWERAETRSARPETGEPKGEASYLALLNTIPDLLVRLDRSGVFTGYIPTRGDYPDLDPNQIIGKPVAEILPEIAPEVLWCIEEALQTDQVQRLEYRLQDNGQLQDYEARIVASGPDEVLVIARNITGQKQAEVEREQLLAAEREQRLLAETLAEVALALAARTNHEAVLDEILRQVQRLVSYSTAHITLLEGEKLRVARWQGYEAFNCAELVATMVQTLADLPLDAEVVARREPLVVPDTRLNPHWVALPETAWIRSYISVPLCLQDRVLGLLRLDSDVPNRFSPGDTTRLLPLANAAAVALENARLYDQVRRELVERTQAEAELTRRNRELLALQYAGSAIASSLELKQILNMVTRELTTLLRVEACAIFSWDRANDTVARLAEYNLARQEQKLPPHIEAYHLANLPLFKQILSVPTARQIRANQPDLTPEEAAYLKTSNVKTILILPMAFQDRMVGLAEVTDGEVECTFSSEEMGLAQLLVNQAASAIRNAQLYDQIRQELAERVVIEEELRQSEARNRAILDAIPDLMFRATRSGKYLDCQGGQTGDFLPASEHIGKTIPDVLPPDIATQILARIEQTLDTGAIQVFEYQLEGPAGRQDYETRLVASGADEVIGIVRNITERKRGEQRIIQAERLAALGRLAAALAHEINNPLQAIQSHLDLVLDFPLAPHEKDEYLHVIRQEIERLKTIARNVLSFARPQAGPLRPVSVVKILEHVLVLAHKQLEHSSIQTSTSFQDVPPVLAAPEQLTQVFLNLVINAIEAIVDHGWLHIEVQAEGDWVCISFTNSGPVIPSHLLPFLFEPFFSTKVEGSGIGLWVSHNLVLQHSGSLTVENLDQDQGVVFRVKLPAIQAGVNSLPGV